MLKLFIGNKAYSSWSMRGWLAAKHSGLEFEEVLVPLYGEDWDKMREGDEFAPGGGKVPILWEDDCVVWDSLAIVEFLADKVGRDVFWPEDDHARAMARSMAAEMHSSYPNLRRELSMNVRRQYEFEMPSDSTVQEIGRILTIWAEARARFGGTDKYLFGRYGAVDIMFAPVATRFVTYSVPLPGFARTYVEALFTHPHVRQWIEEAQDEPWVIERLEQKAR